MTITFARERTLQDEIAPAVESRVPGVRMGASRPFLLRGSE